MNHYLHIIPASILLVSIFGCAAKDPKISTNFPDCAPACVWYNNDNEIIDPIIFRDAKTGVLFYVESDGRHVTAFMPDGRLRWTRNPFEDAHLWPYRVSKPIISSIQDHPESNGILIRYNSTQFGVIEKATGDFTFGGQD